MKHWIKSAPAEHLNHLKRFWPEPNDSVWEETLNNQFVINNSLCKKNIYLWNKCTFRSLFIKPYVLNVKHYYGWDSYYFSPEVQSFQKTNIWPISIAELNAFGGWKYLIYHRKWQKVLYHFGDHGDHSRKGNVGPDSPSCLTKQRILQLAVSHSFCFITFSFVKEE